MKFYIASSLGNAGNVRTIADYLQSRGWNQTYDWTEHGAVKVYDELSQISINEIQGVTGCDLFILLLPGKRGSHAELGAALASKKTVIILSTDQDLFYENGITCSFYWHPNVSDRIIDRDLFALACMAYRSGRKHERKDIELRGKLHE